MNRPRALLVSLAVAAAALAGVFALTSTVSLGSQAHASTDAQVAQRSAQLDRYEASLRKALAEKPPLLPALPTTSVASSAGVPSTAPARVVYQRPPPVVVGSRSGSDHEDAIEQEHEQEQEQEQEQERGHESGGVELDD